MFTDSSNSILHPRKENSLPRKICFDMSNGIDFDLNLVYQLLVSRFQYHLVPGFHVTIDELRIPCHHESCSFKSHNRDKPDIWPIESKSLHADNGYLLDFINPCQGNIPTSHIHFTKYLKTAYRPHHIIADPNFFVCPLFIRDLG
jgi:hypothetical protein